MVSNLILDLLLDHIPCHLHTVEAAQLGLPIPELTSSNGGATQLSKQK